MDGLPRATLITIGELARTTGLPVRTIRFYCDEGILAASRSPGGHRLFDADAATACLTQVRRLRALGLGLPSIVEVLQGECSLDEAVAAESARLDLEFRSLAWRRASLRALEAATPDDRADRLSLLAGAQDTHAARDGLIRFWRRVLPALKPLDFETFVCGTIPEPPVDPTVDEVLAYAELTDLVTDPSLYNAVAQQIWRADSQTIRDRRDLFFAVGDILMDVVPLAAAGVEPHANPLLDRFVSAHATARRERDTPEFRNQLRCGATDSDPRIQRYWALTSDLLDMPVTVGQAHGWLYTALIHSDEPVSTVTEGLSPRQGCPDKHIQP